MLTLALLLVVAIAALALGAIFGAKHQQLVHETSIEREARRVENAGKMAILAADMAQHRGMSAAEAIAAIEHAYTHLGGG